MKTWTVHSRGNRLHGARPRCWLPRGVCTFYICTGSHRYTLTARTFVGIWVAARDRRGSVGPPGYDASHKWSGPAMKKKTAPPPERTARHVAPVETDLLRTCMPLVEHMAVVKYDDNDPREPGWITIRTQGAAWAVVVKDPDSGNSFTSVAQTLDQALETAALLLSCDEAPWAPDAYLKRQKKK